MNTDICGRCLIQVNATSYVAAIWEDNRENAPDPTNPRRLLKWIEGKLYDHGARFEINGMPGCVVSIATWHGDPVCVYHLWVLVEAESRGIGR